MSDGITLDFKVHFTAGPCGSRVMHVGERSVQRPVPQGRVPRISRLMALAIRFDDLVRRGEMRDFAEIAELGHVTRARLSQIINLLNLAPDIQEAVLFLAPVSGESEALPERRVRSIAAEPDWAKQRLSWSDATARPVRRLPHEAQSLHAGHGVDR